MSLTRLLARPMLASAFVADGVDALRHPDAHAAKFKDVAPLLEKAGVPPVLSSDARTLARVSGGLTAVAGLMLATGRRPRTAALALALVNVPITVINNPVWSARGKEQRKEYTKGLVRGVSLGGGLLFAASDRYGKPSLGWRMSNYKQQRAKIRDAKSSVRDRYTA